MPCLEQRRALEALAPAGSDGLDVLEGARLAAPALGSHFPRAIPEEPLHTRKLRSGLFQELC